MSSFITSIGSVKFTPGVQKAFYLYQKDAPYGFWFYAPPHLHGLDEHENSTNNPGGMNIILWNGASKLIKSSERSMSNHNLASLPYIISSHF